MKFNYRILLLVIPLAIGMGFSIGMTIFILFSGETNTLSCFDWLCYVAIISLTATSVTLWNMYKKEVMSTKGSKIDILKLF